MGAELLHKIKKNPWKTLGTVLLATAFPAGTVIAGTIAAGVVIKSGHDAYVNKNAATAINPLSSPPTLPNRLPIKGYMNQKYHRLLLLLKNKLLKVEVAVLNEKT